ncbi:histidine protein methyltransferase 1 homolog [Sphaerodactylus townsendi]|uniref:histidine protein methyltransferase 1 homolog n=1 Tax=Sphaerodactylus townsendi TaxID=933632 RepID=UPI002026C7A0|nr:histidine protein methyltransferase 1 homolog [Sphaerodactylus townsendi]XP_048353507.1 histidine protein methyltransferase 1 homolog [Sphaerodactylus townsendi]XP_048353508.1 histidine protein methyltransferase 1 homolog [Sphaerodactylus townsendi]
MAFQFNFSIENTDESRLGALEDERPQRELKQESLTLSDKQEGLAGNRNDPSSGEDTFNQELLSERPVQVADHSSLNRHHDITLPEMFSCPAPSKAHDVPKDVCKVLENKVVETLPGHMNIYVVKAELTNYSHGDSILTKSISSHSDLITGVYEGGLKIWECTFDLIDYFSEAEVQFANKVVLDLGCGSGLLGITALKGNAEMVHFQDYNGVVIEETTLPNILVNCICRNGDSGGITGSSLEQCQERDFDHDLISKCKFFSGEWSGFRHLLLNSGSPLTKYDLIITSETIYNPDYYDALHETLSELLKANGCIYLASKAHYFGCGGGVMLFAEFVKKKGVFSSRTVKIVDKGLKRFIIELVFKNPS